MVPLKGTAFGIVGSNPTEGTGVWRSGDALDLGSSVRKDLWVRIPSHLHLTLEGTCMLKRIEFFVLMALAVLLGIDIVMVIGWKVALDSDPVAC